MEREQTAERTQFALDAVAREGRARSRFTPFGWRNADNGWEAVKGDRRPLIPHAGERRILRRILRLRKRGNGVKSIAARLNTPGVLNPRTGSAWSHGTVAAILRTVERRKAAGARTAV